MITLWFKGTPDEVRAVFQTSQVPGVARMVKFLRPAPDTGDHLPWPETCGDLDDCWYADVYQWFHSDHHSLGDPPIGALLYFKRIRVQPMQERTDGTWDEVPMDDSGAASIEEDE